jgi:acyl-CoA dehydrogenase
VEATAGEQIRTIRVESALDLEPLRNFVRSEILPWQAGESAATEFPWEIHRALHRLGVPQAAIPVELGGRGAPMIDLLCMARELAYGSAGITTSTLINILAMTSVILFGDQDLRRRLCNEFLQEYSLWSYCMTEPEAGSDLFNLRTTARRVEGGYVLQGAKQFITNGSLSSHLVVYGRLLDAPRRGEEVTLFYVPGEAPGLTRGAPLRKMGQRESDTAPIFLDEVFVPTAHRLGAEGQGLDINTRCLQRSKALIGAGGVGICRRAFDLVTQRLADRVLFRRPLLQQPAIRHQLAALWTEVEAAWLLSCAAGEKWDSGASSVKEASMAKMFSAHTTVKFVNEALELFGGYGYLSSCEIERLYRDAKVLEIFEGPTLIQQLLIAGELFPPPALPARTAMAPAAVAARTSPAPGQTIPSPVPVRAGPDPPDARKPEVPR